ncbi:protoporphyrinogen oxidase [Phormidium sp. CCY1219]|uniref:protoporphyrinogen oxidase n=1 Tax=Phormidium sp. CCY1219 TaxID=2886104 RepID=UPI002D1F1DE1|nr:protoporphyrinogen oxidase [Phormidium sp. CCY1219]MEB3831278.1 protoporphyrinogen oxidase [Phormidium sp. CCY1219]
MTEAANPSTTVDVLIVGAGISGLSMAHDLQHPRKSDRPFNILVAESQGRVGGRIVTASGDGFLWESGPNSFAPTPELMKLAVDVGLKDELLLADRFLPRFVYWQGELMPVPMSPPAMVKSKLLSVPGKLRALVGALGFVGPKMGSEEREETVAEFFRRHLGDEVLKRLVEPFVSGVYAGDPNQLSASAAFSRVKRLEEIGGGLVAGAILSAKNKKKPAVAVDPNVPQAKRGQLGSFREGLEALPKAIAGTLGDAVKLNWHLLRLSPREKGTYIAEFSTPEGVKQVESRSVVLTTPTYASVEILEPLDVELGMALKGITYPSVACVVLGYPTEAFKRPMKGFGNLIPRGQGIRTLGTIWGSSLFPGRAPQGWEMVINFIGGATDNAIANLSEEEIVNAVHRDLCQTLLGEDVEPKVLAVHLWKRAIPQYNLGHLQRLHRIERQLQQFPGLYLCGNYSDGVALGDCVRRAQEGAEKLREYLR